MSCHPRHFAPVSRIRRRPPREASSGSYVWHAPVTVPYDPNGATLLLRGGCTWSRRRSECERSWGGDRPRNWPRSRRWRRCRCIFHFRVYVALWLSVGAYTGIGCGRRGRKKRAELPWLWSISVKVGLVDKSGIERLLAPKITETKLLLILTLVSALIL